jgi:hypothetical protein
MWKAAVVAVVGAFALAGTTILMAQDRGPGPRPGYAQGERNHPLSGAIVMGREHGPWSIDDMKAFVDARIAALRAGLELRPDQDKNWPPFEQAVRAAAKERLDRMQARQAAGDGQQQATDPVERLRRVADAMSRRGAALKQVADAAAPLYQSLDDAQKNRFRVLARFGHHRHHGGWHRRFEQREDDNR